MRKRIPWVALCAAFAAGGCVSGHISSSELRARAEKAPDTAKACAEWRWVAVRSRSTGVCPAVPGWTANQLFKPEDTGKDKASAQRENRDARPVPNQLSTDALVAELQRFCVYQTANPRADARKLPFPAAAKRELVRFDQDCAALSIAADPLTPEVWKPAADLFLAQAGKPATPLQIQNENGVRLAFLDTQPTTMEVPTEPGYSQHGYTMAHIARHLVCSPPIDGRCAAEITTRLALPIQRFDPKRRSQTKIIPNEGGHIGLQSDLAEAITGEVDQWLQQRLAGRAPQHLVLNLSLGWDPQLFGGLDEEQIAELRAGSQAVYRALQYAASQDVLVLSAAGNKKTCDPELEGPALPAGWERTTPADLCGVGQGPLVYAVGGVRTNGDKIPNSRPRGMPRRAAYAEHAVVPTFNPEVPTAMYTGTSVATAVASSIAAVVWDTRPELRAQQVMELIGRDSATELLALEADFWAGSGSSAPASTTVPRVHRLSLCRALKEACNPPGTTGCPLPSGYECERWEPSEMVALEFPPDAASGGTCQPWVFPAPEDLPCPNCIKEPPQ